MRWKNPCCNNKTQRNSWQIMENLRKQCRSKANQNNLWGVNHIRSTITSSCEGQDTPSMIQTHRELAFLRNSGTGMRGGDGEVEETKMVVTKKPKSVEMSVISFYLMGRRWVFKAFHLSKYCTMFTVQVRNYFPRKINSINFKNFKFLSFFVSLLLYLSNRLPIWLTK